MTTVRRVIRYKVAADNKPHTIGAGRVLLVVRNRAARHHGCVAGVVEVWVEVDSPADWPARATPAAKGTQNVIVCPTASAIPPGAHWLGSCLDHTVAWHLYRCFAQGATVTQP